MHCTRQTWRSVLVMGFWYSAGALRFPSIRTPPLVRVATSSAIESPVRIRVIGLGGGGSNAINRMVEALGTDDNRCIQFISCNTDAQALQSSLAPSTLQIGPLLTRGLGAGGRPEVGYKAALESADAIRAEVEGQDMVFVTAGMGGGTGTGAAPVVAKMAKEAGALSVGVVSKPFSFEGKKRAGQAEAAIAQLRSCVDVLIVVSNDRLLQIVPEGMSLVDSFALADEVCASNAALPHAHGCLVHAHEHPLARPCSLRRAPPVTPHCRRCCARALLA